jgi:NAD(P)-dependent dehydrogenase (short-subunit alcohol dehydrogenase family)
LLGSDANGVRVEKMETETWTEDNCHPATNTSYVSGVGTRSPLAAYGFNRDEYSYIPGGRPEFMELKDFPYHFNQKEYVIHGAGSYIFDVLAAQWILGHESGRTITEKAGTKGKMNLDGKVCLITGGSSGIGAATALEFAGRGADIVICGLPADDALAQGVKREVEALNRRAVTITADVADPAAAVDCVRQTIASLGKLDMLIHCAGGPAQGGLLEVDVETWYKAFDIHVHAVFHLARAAAPCMARGGGGVILLISSAAGVRGCAGAIAYGVAKGAIPQFTRALARELADCNIRVNCVSPGIIRTRFQDYLTPEQVENNIRNRIPLRREGRPEDVAAVLAALAENDFITGAEVPVDGGMAMRMV